MNTATWILGKTAEQLYDGTGNWVSEQRLYYNPQGRVTFTQALKDVSGSNTADVAVAYDTLGNVSSRTEFTATGNTSNPSTNGRNGVTTAYGYDAKFGYYVITLTNPLAQVTRYTYYGVNEASPTTGQPFGVLAVVRDPNGNQTAYAFDPFGRLRTVAKPGNTLSNPSEVYQYYDGVDTGDGTLSQTVGITSGAVNPLLVVHLTYGGTGTHFTNSSVAAWERTFYDGLGHVIETQTSAVGKDKVAYTLYNSEGQAYAQSVPYLASPYTYATSVVNGVTKMVNPYQTPDLSQQRSTTQYDVLGRVVGSTGADGSTATTSYAIGADTQGAQTTLTVDPLYHRRVSVSDMLGRVTAVREYTTTPWVNEVENYAGVDTKYLDHKTNTAVVSKPAPFSVDPTENFIYGPGYTVTVAGPGQVLLFRLAIDSATAPDAYVGNIQVFAHTSAPQGQIVAIRWIRRSEFQGGLTNFSEFALPFDTTGLQGAVLEFRFWWAGNAQMAVDRTTVYWTDSPSQVTQYHYDVRDNLTSVTDALNNTTVITYDGFGRKVGMRDLDMGVWTYGYDVMGNLTTQTDANGQTLWFGYDKLNRQTEKRVGDSTGTLLAQYTYDQGTNGLGHRTSTSNANAATTWTYDIRGRVGAEEMSFTGVTGTFGSAIHYDSLDRPIWQRLPNGEMVTTAYDAAGQATSLSAGGQGLVTGATYNALGQPSVITYGNTLKARYLYFGLDIPSAVDGHAGTYMYGWLRRICVLPQASATDCEGEALTTTVPLLNLGYNYDANQNVTVLRDDTKRQRESFQYDNLDRLTLAYPNDLTTTATISGYYQSYAYDAIGNFTNFSGTLYANSNPAHKHAVTHLDGVQRYWYDANGNMTVRIEKGVVYTQTWDVENRLVEVISGTQHTQYFYDADGQRVKRITSQGTTLYVGADYEVTGPSQIVTPTYAHKLYLPVMACTNCTGVPAVNPPPMNVASARVTYRFNGQPVAVREGETLTFVHGDHLGSTNLTTNISGTKVSELRYYPFGETRYSSGTTSTSKRFTSQEEQIDIGLYDYGARFYDPILGRFVSADSVVPQPGDPQSLNRFAYVRNSPLARVDPSGHGDTCNRLLFHCGDSGSSDPTQTLPSPTVVSLNPETIQQVFHQSGARWADIGADFQNALHTAIGWREGNWNDVGSAVSLPWYEHPGTWVAGIVAGGYACVAFCGEVAATIGGVGTSISQGATQLFAYCLANSFCARLFGYGAKPDNARIVRNLADQVAEGTGGVLGEASGSGWKITVPNATANKGFTIVVRIMESSKQRAEPYVRVAVGTITSLTVDGQPSNDAALTHININLSNPSETLNQVLHMIDAAKSQW